MILLNTTYTNPTFFKGLLKIQNFFISDQYKLKKNNLLKLNELTINEILFQNFKKFNYLFSFYIYKVDKQIYKNSRGKSGKYTFVWKYVAPYKRNFLILHWLTKEIRIAPGKTLQDRVDHVIHNFICNTHNTWIWKIKKFSLNYVYYNLRKTLGETYKNFNALMTMLWTSIIKKLNHFIKVIISYISFEFCYTHIISFFYIILNILCLIFFTSFL